MSYFERVGFEFDVRTQKNKIMQGIQFTRTGCNKYTYWFQKDKQAACDKNAGTSLTEGLTLNVAAVDGGLVDYNADNATWVNWVGSPMGNKVLSLERLAFKCPAGKVPTSLYFERAGCNTLLQNFSTWALGRRQSAEDYPGCLANSQEYNDGLSLVAVCRPEASLARGMWMWIDAGYAAPIVNPSDLSKLGGLCPSGYAMTGAYMNARGCGQNLTWQQLLTRAEVAPKCSVPKPGEKTKTNGLQLRLHCTRFGKDIHECGPLASHVEWPCDDDAQCLTSEFGGTRCVCNPGYDGIGRNGTCRPINPCAVNRNICPPRPGGQCNYLAPGKYNCTCRPGYQSVNGGCKAIGLTSNNNTAVYGSFQAKCTFGGRPDSTISGSFTFQSQRNPTTGDAQGTMIDVNLVGANLRKVYRWDIRRDTVDTAEDLDACWSAGPIFNGAGIGFTSKYGRIPTTNSRYFDSDIMLFGKNSVVGRSIVLESEDGDYLACCSIHLVGASGGSPAVPTQAVVQATVGVPRADCNFADGRSVQLYQQRNYIGAATGAAGPEDLHYQSVGSTWVVNPPTVLYSTQFLAQTDARNFATPTAGSFPPLETCSSGRPFLGGLTQQNAGRWLEYRITGARLFRQIRIEGSFWFLGVWKGEIGYISIKVANSNPALDFVVWSQAYTGTGPCTDGGNNRILINTTYTLDMPRSNVNIRFWTSLGTGSTGSFALTSYSHSTPLPFRITLQPVLAEQNIRNRPFTGQDDLSSWTKVDNTGARTPPVVGQCTTPGANYSLLGGLSILKSTDVLEFKQTTSSYTRLNVAFTFWFQKGWSGQTATIEMFKTSAPTETIVIWSRTGNNQPGSTIRCGGVGTDYFEFVNVTKVFQQPTDQILIRIRITGSLTGTASWGLSSWSVQTLPTQSAWDIHNDRFRSLGKGGWLLGTAAVKDSDFIYCEDGSSKYWGYYNSYAFDDRSIRGGLNIPITYNSVTTRNFTRGMITFSIHFLDGWVQNSHFAYLDVTGIGQVWKNTADRGGMWRRGCWWGDTNRGWAKSEYVSIPFTFPTTQTSMQLKWYTNLPSPLATHSFVISSLQLTTYPDNDQLLQVDASLSSSQWTAGDVYFGGHSAGPVTLPPGGAVTTKPCTIPAEMWPTVTSDSRTQTLLGWKQFRNGAVRYKATTARPYAKAIAHYYYFFMDVWSPDYAFLRMFTFNPVASAAPMRWLFREVHYYTDNYSPRPNFACGGMGYGTNYRRHAVTVLERTATSNIDLYWQSTIARTDNYGSFAVSNLKMIYFPPVEVVTLVTGSQSQFDTDAGLTPFKTWVNGAPTTPQTVTCGSGSGTNKVIWARSIQNGCDLRYTTPTQVRPFRQIRVSFRLWFIGAWYGERATLFTQTAEGEMDNIWRGDHYQQPQWNWVSNQRTGNSYCTIPRNPSTSPWERYEEVMVEGTFNTATRSVTLIWGNKLTYGDSTQSMGVSHINIQIVPETYPVPVETSNFISTGDSLDGWNMFKDGAWTKPVVTPCGAGSNDAIKQHLVGGRTRLGPIEKLKFETGASDAKAPFKTAHVYFRYWFLPTWGANDMATLSVREFGKPTEAATWSMKFPFPVANQAINCDVDQTTMYRDVGFTIKFAAPTRNVLQFVFGVSSATGSLTPRFAISAFRLDVEKPDPDWALQAACPGSTYRPADGLSFTTSSAAGTPFGLGDLKNKHGQFNTKNFIDNGIPMSGPYTAIGKSIALYEAGTNTNAMCCTISRVAGTPDPVQPPVIPFATAGCVWKNANTEGWVSFRAPGTDGVATNSKGTFINVFGRFFGAEANNNHHFSINQRGFSLVDNAGGKCPLAITGDIYGSGGVPDDFIGPSSSAYSLGNMAFNGVAGSSRARIGDLSGKWGRLKGVMTDPFSFVDSQVNLAGPYSVVGRSVVVMSVAGTPLACCTIGFGPVGGLNRGADYYDAKYNYTQPQVADYPRYLDPLDIEAEDDTQMEPENADNYPFWNAGRVAAVTIGCAAAALLAGAVAASAAAPGGAAAVDAGEGYVAM